MLLKDEKWKSCKSCKRRTSIIRQSVFGCDACKTVIELLSNLLTAVSELYYNDFGKHISQHGKAGAQ